MANARKIAPVQTFHQQVFSAALATGRALQDAVALLKSGIKQWVIVDKATGEARQTDHVKAVALEYRLGRMASYLGLATRDEAKVVNDKPRHSKSEPSSDKRRTAIEEKAYQAGVSAWDHVARLSGMPPRKGGSGARPAQSKADGQKASAAAAAAAQTPPQAAGEATWSPEVAKAVEQMHKLDMPAQSEKDMADIAAWLADHADKAIRNAGKTKVGPWFAILTDFAKAVDAALKASEPVVVAPVAPAQAKGKKAKAA